MHLLFKLPLSWKDINVLRGKKLMRDIVSKHKVLPNESEYMKNLIKCKQINSQ